MGKSNRVCKYDKFAVAVLKLSNYISLVFFKEKTLNKAFCSLPLLLSFLLPSPHSPSQVNEKHC